MSECRNKCGTQIEWRKIEKTNLAIPVETEPSVWGNLVLNRDGKTCRIAGEKEYMSNRLSAAPKLYLSHTGQCLKVDKFRLT